MKALVALLSVAVVSSSHVLERRSLLGVGQDHEHHHEHHDEHERTGRDSPVSAPAGYLPPAEDDYADYDDDSAGFGAGKGDSTDSNVRGQDSGNEQSQYGQNQRSPQSGAVGNAVGRQSANGRNQQDGNQRVKFGQQINQNLQNPSLTRQQGSRRNQQGRGRNQQKAQRNNQFGLEKDEDGSLGTYGNEIDPNLNNQQQDQPGRQENSQRGQGINSQFGNFEDSTGQSQYGQNTPQSGNDFIAQSGQRRQGQQNQAGGQRNQGQQQGISLQSEDNQFDQGLQGNSQTQSGQLSQGGQGQKQNRFGNQQLEDQPADASYGAPGQGQSNKKSKIGLNQRGQNQRGQNQRGQNQRGHNQLGQNQRGQNQRGQDQIGQNQRRQNQRGQNQRGQNQRGQNQVGFNQADNLRNQQVQGQSADESYGAPGQGQGNIKSQIGQNKRGQSQRGQNQTGQQNKRGQNQKGPNQRGQNQVGFSQGNDLGNQQVQDQSANESYGAPRQDNNKFQIVQNQRETNQQGQNQGGQNDKIQNQRGQNQSDFSSQFDSPVAIRPTINRFLPSNKEILNSEYGAPPTGQNSQGSQSGQNSQGDQSGRNSQRDQTGTRRNGNTGNSFAAQGVQPGTGSNGFPFSSTESNDLGDNFKFEDTLICPGGTVEACIKVCPGNTALLYGGCVQGCAERCDAQGQGSQFGQQGIPGQNIQLVQQGQPIISGQSKQQGQTGQSQGAEDQQGQYGQQTD